jgi:methionine--tRNA ligase beta chain
MTSAAFKPVISKDILDRIDIRVGTIRAVADVAASKKLVRLTVDVGGREISVLAGLRGERENPAEIVGRQALFVVNLEPRRMAGEISEGMLFDIGFEDGIRPVLAVPEAPVPDGSRAG